MRGRVVEVTRFGQLADRAPLIFAGYLRFASFGDGSVFMSVGGGAPPAPFR